MRKLYRRRRTSRGPIIMDGSQPGTRIIYIGSTPHTARQRQGVWKCGKLMAATIDEMVKMLEAG